VRLHPNYTTFFLFLLYPQGVVNLGEKGGGGEEDFKKGGKKKRKGRRVGACLCRSFNSQLIRHLGGEGKRDNR